MKEFLINKKFNSISRAIDMMCLFIGDDFIFVSNGKEIKVSEYALHVQTQWRFTKDDIIILGSYDIYIPNCEEQVSDDWEYDIVGRKDGESSVFDVKVKSLSSVMENSTVTDVSISAFGDIRIMFSNGVKFELFIPVSQKDERWRLIDYKTDNHIVFYDTEG